MFKKRSDPEEIKALEKLVRKTFCGNQSVVGCSYYEKSWCEKNCGFYKKSIEQAKYWNRK